MIVTVLKRLPTYLSHRESGPNVVRKQSFEKMKFWNFFLGDCDQAFEKATYVPLL